MSSETNTQEILPSHFGHMIGGEWIDSKTTFPTESPHNGQKLADIALGGNEEIEMAVGAAEQALRGPWGQASTAERSRYLQKLADLIEQNHGRFSALEALDTGKPVMETSNGDIPRAIANLRFYAELVLKTPSKKWTSDDGSTHRTIREPIGVCGLITPWNLPLYLLTWKLAPALACGNTVIIKPAELTPLSAILLGELIGQAGLPPGVVNIVQGYGKDGAGEALVAHPKVKAISFTGETTTGAAIMQRAAPYIKKLSFELGGKGANIIFPDADLKRAGITSERAAFRNQGQICLAGSRLICHANCADEVIATIVGRTKEIQMGAPLDPNTTMGSLISKEHRDKVAAYVNEARNQGAEIVTGGNVPQHLAEGAYYEPTIIKNLPKDAKCLNEEVFGPVLTVQTFRTIEEAIEIVNDTPYGLSCSIWSEDEATLEKVTSQVRTGLVWHNSWFLRNFHAAFGGMKKSGIGREGGEYSLDFFSELKTISAPCQTLN